MANDFDIRDVLEWARTKPADEQYDFCNASNCAVAQFGKETGRGHLVGLLSGDIDTACPGLLWLVSPTRGGPEELTFGALVKRLEAIVTPLSVWTGVQAYLDADCGEYVA